MVSRLNFQRHRRPARSGRVVVACGALLLALPGLHTAAQPGDAGAPGARFDYVPVQDRRVSLQQAIEIAMNVEQGRVVRADTVNRNGRVVHEVLIIRDDGLVRTVHIDPDTGNVL